MTSFRKIRSYPDRLIMILTVLILFSGFPGIKSQVHPPHPPRPIRLDVIQTLGFGAFYIGSTGGCITVNTSGIRSVTGDVVPLNLAGYPYFQALIEIRAHPGTVITFSIEPVVYLTRDGGGGAMRLDAGPSSPLSPIVATSRFSEPIELYIGGKLSVGNLTANPTGNYSGQFEIIFMQQ